MEIDGPEPWVVRLAAALVDQLRPLLPDTVAISVDDVATVWLEADRPGRAGFGFGAVVYSRDALVGPVTTLLDHVQDFLVLHTRTPWPGPETATVLPLPRVEVVGDRVEGWYGSMPVLAVEL